MGIEELYIYNNLCSRITVLNGPRGRLQYGVMIEWLNILTETKLFTHVCV